MLIFDLKFDPFLKSDDKVKLLESIILYINKAKENTKYNLFLKYFKKKGRLKFYWAWFIRDENIKHRTNNQAEIFHRLINQTIEFNHPKISFLVSKLSLIVRNKYSEYIINENRINNKIYEKYNILLIFMNLQKNLVKNIVKILILIY